MISSTSSNEMKNNIMQELKDIKRLAAPNYLLTRIEGKLEEVKPLISLQLVAIYSIVLLCFVLVSTTKDVNHGDKAVETYAQQMGMFGNNNIYGNE